MIILDFFCGRFGASRVFAERGWEVIGFDIVEPPEIPPGCTFTKRNLLGMTAEEILSYSPDFLWASSPCEEFSVWAQRHFHPNPKFPDMGLVLFCWTRRQFEKTGLPWIMENVRGAERFVGTATGKCGPFHLWGPGVPLIMPQGLKKGYSQVGRKRAQERGREFDPLLYIAKEERSATIATIPMELSHCVANWAERLVEQRKESESYASAGSV